MANSGIENSPNEKLIGKIAISVIGQMMLRAQMKLSSYWLE